MRWRESNPNLAAGSLSLHEPRFSCFVLAVTINRNLSAFSENLRLRCRGILLSVRILVCRDICYQEDPRFSVVKIFIKERMHAKRIFFSVRPCFLDMLGILCLQYCTAPSWPIRAMWRAVARQLGLQGYCHRWQMPSIHVFRLILVSCCKPVRAGFQKSGLWPVSFSTPEWGTCALFPRISATQGDPFKILFKLPRSPKTRMKRCKIYRMKPWFKNRWRRHLSENGESYVSDGTAHFFQGPSTNYGSLACALKNRSQTSCPFRPKMWRTLACALVPSFPQRSVSRTTSLSCFFCFLERPKITKWVTNKRYITLFFFFFWLASAPLLFKKSVFSVE